MSLYTDPLAIIESLRMGKFQEDVAKREINDLLSEISSGIYTPQDLGLKNERELRGLRHKCRHKTLH
ncbi:MAG: hypothetical protein RBS77_01900 [Candidatus Moranbacteria bacterium]|jgi:hypothetical protein|nr:hypothetical protein [Candidatus Moranbacteria bacterium]